jgi:hypothetical protein
MYRRFSGTHYVRRHMKPTNLLIIATASIALLGCVTAYVPPLVSDKTARLRISQATKGSQTLVMSASKACLGRHNSDDWHVKIAMLDGSVVQMQPHLRQSLGMPDPLVPAENLTETRIMAGQPFHLAINRTVSNTPFQEVYCNMGVTFTPEASVDYEALIEVSGRQCFFTVNKLDRSGSSVIRSPVPAQRLAACR